MPQINARWAWVGLVGFVVAWDIACDDQLSHAFRRAPRAVTAPVVGIVVLHLYEVIPKRYDPIHLLLSKNRAAQTGRV